MSKIPENKNEFIIWLNSNEGQDCIQPQDFTKPGSTKYLENRLWYAWTAGMGKQLEHSLERIGELEKEVIRVKDLLAQMWYTNYGDIMNDKTIYPADQRWQKYKESNKL